MIVANELSLNKETQLFALLHDASEAYIGDVPTPIKRLIPQFTEIENSILKAILDSYNYDLPGWQEKVDFAKVHKIDKSVLVYEMSQNMTCPIEISLEALYTIPAGMLVPSASSSQVFTFPEKKFLDCHATLVASLKEQYKNNPKKMDDEIPF